MADLDAKLRVALAPSQERGEELNSVWVATLPTGQRPQSRPGP
jgi:hypothetical protein